MILRAKWVLPVSGPPLENGTVTIEGDTITAVGEGTGGRDLGDVVLAPGLINAHCHLEYTALAGKVPYRGCFTDWLFDLVALKRQMLPAEYAAGMQVGLEQSLASGTTTILDITSQPAPVTPLRVLAFPELIDIAQPVGTLPETADGLSPHAPYTASADLYQRCAATGNLLTTHLAETDEEDEMFRWGRGPMFAAFEKFGRDMRDCRHVGPVSLLHNYGVLGPRCLAAHANVLTQADVDLLRQTGTSVVHCPKSHRFFNRGTPRLPSLIAAGLNVCLGTDSLASNDRLDMFAEMQEVARVFPHWSAAEVLRLATVNAARALHRVERLGQIAVGAAADLIAVPLNGSADPYEAVVFSEAPVVFLMANGKVIRE